MHPPYYSDAPLQLDALRTNWLDEGGTPASPPDVPPMNPFSSETSAVEAAGTEGNLCGGGMGRARCDAYGAPAFARELSRWDTCEPDQTNTG